MTRRQFDATLRVGVMFAIIAALIWWAGQPARERADGRPAAELCEAMAARDGTDDEACRP